MQHKKHGAQFYGKPLVFLLRLMFSDSMARRIPPLNALRAFEAAARSGGFAAAANELGVTPGAISRHVRLLEDRTGHTLFERHPRSLVLTPRGHDLLAVVSEALDRLEAGTQAALSPAPRAKLSLNVQTSLAIGWMLPRLARLHRDRTDLELELSTQIETPDLRARKADAAIVHGRGPWPELEAHFLFADRLQPVCSPGYLAARPGLQAAEPRALLAETLLVSRTAPDDWAQWFAHAGLRGARPRRAMVFGSSLLPAQAALHGLGLALVDLALVRDELDAGRLVTVAGRTPLVRGTGYYLVYAPGRSEEAGVQALRSWLQEEAPQSARPEQ
jgi:LysR family glycine cleavage system transcriptional activator